ncbi:hypothetical protein F5X96DRAFT_671316 [Biscogniauxia mediterranea]|nr:hypothetical protein F5X96DRAFT_671316 [Biscogniauxia mediterranea]
MAANASTDLSTYFERVREFYLTTIREYIDGELRTLKQQHAEDLNQRIMTLLEEKRPHLEAMVGEIYKGCPEDVIDEAFQGLIPDDTIQQREWSPDNQRIVIDLTKPVINCTSCCKVLESMSTYAYDECGCVVCFECGQQKGIERGEFIFYCSNYDHKDKYEYQLPVQIYYLEDGCNICFCGLDELSKLNKTRLLRAVY